MHRSYNQPECGRPESRSAVNRLIFLVERTEDEPFDRIEVIEWNAVEFDRSLRVENVLCLPQVD